jgi:hypothetical protein
VFAAVTALACAGLVCGAALASAPPVAIVLIAVVCILCPMAATWPLPDALAVLRAVQGVNASQASAEARAVAGFRRHLRDLPETDHPLGL